MVFHITVEHTHDFKYCFGQLFPYKFLFFLLIIILIWYPHTSITFIVTSPPVHPLVRKGVCGILGTGTGTKTPPRGCTSTVPASPDSVPTCYDLFGKYKDIFYWIRTTCFIVSWPSSRNLLYSTDNTPVLCAEVGTCVSTLYGGYAPREWDCYRDIQPVDPATHV